MKKKKKERETYDIWPSQDENKKMATHYETEASTIYLNSHQIKSKTQLW